MWKKLALGNCVLDGKGFYISFRCNTAKVKDLPEILENLFAADTINGETALVKDGHFYILNGDFREQYLFLVKKGFEECKKFFDMNKEYHSSWSA